MLNSYPNDVEKRIYSGLYSATLGFLSDDNDAILRAADNVEDIVRKQLANSSLRDTYLSSLAMYYVKAGDYKKAIKLLPAEKDKEHYWRMYERQIADAGRYAEEGNDRSEFGGVVYYFPLIPTIYLMICTSICAPRQFLLTLRANASMH